MTEPIYVAIVKNKQENPFVFANYVLSPQVPIQIKIYKNSDLKKYKEYVTVNVIEEILVILDNSSSGSGNAIASGKTYVFPFEASNFTPNGARWKVTVTHNLGRVPDINVYDEYENILYGDIDHENTSTPNSFTITFNQKVKCTVYIN